MTMSRRSPVVPITALALGSVLLAIGAWRGAPPLATAIGFGVVLVYAGVLWVFQTRSETVATLAGKPVDERWAVIHERALGFAGTIGAVAALGGYAALQVAGRENWQFLFMGVVLGVGYIGGVVWFRLRA